jgi:hypothetical protein
VVVEFSINTKKIIDGSGINVSANANYKGEDCLSIFCKDTHVVLCSLKVGVIKS